MTQDVANAMALLYKMEQKLKVRSSYKLNRIEGALDQLSRNPDNVGEPRKLVRSALGNSSTALRKREECCPVEYCDFQDITYTPVLSTDNNEKHLTIEIRDFIFNGSFSKSDKVVLFGLLEGKNAKEIAKINEVPLNQMRVRITRVRAKAKRLWGVA